MHIGIDFDNTIADYTGVFHRVAVKLGWLPIQVGSSKSEVKQYFISNGQHHKWTELQGIVYGKEIMQSKPYLGCLEAIKQLKNAGHLVTIISHKTRYPIICNDSDGKVNFHQAATTWLLEYGFIGHDQAPVSQTSVFFNETKEDKLSRIEEQGCDVFIDDLTAIFSHPLFPIKSYKVLFDPQSNCDSFSCGSVLTHWDDFFELINEGN